jgi:hypothetical protein
MGQIRGMPFGSMGRIRGVFFGKMGRIRDFVQIGPV